MRKLGTLGITFFGLWALILSISGFFNSINYLVQVANEPVVPWAVLVSISPGIALLTAGIILIASRHRLARSLFEDEPLSVEIDPVVALRIGLILSALWMLVDSGASIIYSIAYRLAIAVNDRIAFGGPQGGEPLYATIATAIPQLFILVAALLLIRFSQTAASRIWNGRQRLEDAVIPKPDLPRCEKCGEPYDSADYEAGADARCIGCGEPLSMTGA